MLKQRILTAVILIPIFILLLLKLSPSGFAYLTIAFVLIGAWEWSNLLGIKQFSRRLIYPGFIFICLPISLFIPMSIILVTALIWWIIALGLVVLYPAASKVWGKGYILRGLMGLLVFIPTWRALNYIRDVDPMGTYFLLFLFVLIWGADSGAYFVGKKWGRNKLAPNVSPGKTLQGMYGALLVTLLIAVIAAPVFHLPWLSVVLLSIITVVFSILGDLFESMLKRNVGIKDSGQLFPGHGGLLDRIDSLTAAAPIFALCELLILKNFH